MAFTVPSVGTKTSDQQSVVNEVDTNTIQAGVSGLDCVLSGCAVTGSGTTSVAVAKGAVLSNGTMFAVAANATFGTWTADATHPRIDIVVVDSSGTLTRRAGTAAADPVMPALSANDVLLASVWIPANESPIAIVSADITDKRMFRDVGAITVYKTIAAETTNNVASPFTVEALNKANSGVTIPSGLFLTGKMLRVRMGGNILANASTTTLRWKVIYGGTTMYDTGTPTGSTTTNDTDRLAWFMEFNVLAQGTSDQAMVGKIITSIVGAKTAPTTGIGPGWGTANPVWSMAGSAAVDSDAANRLLSVQILFSAQSANIELVTEYASVELV